ncbi:MAG: ABC transporter permease, partial [Roseburia sp.]|nr:ABC transporter permease [Roseburia sp.]
MKSYLELIPVSAKVHRRQNRMTLLCIIFAVFLVATVFSVTDMDLRLEKERMIEKHGNWHVSFQNLPESDGEEIAGRSDVAVAAWSGAVNETADIDKTYSIGGKKVILYGAEESYLTEIWKGLTEGNYPEDEGEILLSPNARELLGIWIGDSITVDTPEGSFPFTVSGFCETDSELNDISDSVSAYMDMAAFEKFCAKTGEEFAPELSVRFRQESKVKKNLAEIQEQYVIPEENISENTGVLGVMGFSRNSSMKNMYSLALVVFLMVLAAGVLMIAGSMN